MKGLIGVTLGLLGILGLAKEAMMNHQSPTEPKIRGKRSTETADKGDLINKVNADAFQKQFPLLVSTSFTK